jgi:xanthine/uracil permease
MFEGEKTRVFWWGLVIFGSALSGLFANFWYIFVFSYGYDYWRFFTPLIFGSIVFLLIGLYMMKSGVRKERETTSSPTQL